VKYLMVLPVACRRVDEDRFATESAFARHLGELRESMSDFVDEIVVAAVEMSDDDWSAKRQGLGTVSFRRDGVRYVSLVEAADHGRLWYLASRLPRVVARLAELVREVDIVSAGPDEYAFRPMTFPALLLGAAMRKPTISTTDIDQRWSGRMMYESGLWSRRAYLSDRLIHRPSLELQHRLLVQLAHLVMLKGEGLKASYGPHRDHVKVFHDTAFSTDDIVDSSQLEQKLERLRSGSEGLRLVYFGRFVDYKGVDHMIRAVAESSASGPTLSIIGQGPEESHYRAEIGRLGVADRVVVEPPLPYGQPLFERIREADLLLAAPLHEDTPRSLWDAFAAGLGVVAYDTAYYSGLAQSTGAVEIVPWNDPAAMGARLSELARDRGRVAEMARRAAEVARQNTQSVWLTRRAEWTREAVRAAGLELPDPSRVAAS
jgi:glycosyltransferase involved in cell wall biosynthesis